MPRPFAWFSTARRCRRAKRDLLTKSSPVLKVSLAFVAAVFGFALVVPIAGLAQETMPVTSPAVQSAIAAAVQRDRVRYGGSTPIPGAVIGVWDGKGTRRHHGPSAMGTWETHPVTADDHFRIGSNTKTFVVAIMLQLVDEKKLTPRRPGQPVPPRRHPSRTPRNITVRELCDMRSGLFEAYHTPQFARLNYHAFRPRTSIHESSSGGPSSTKPYFPPGRGFHYSNTNYLLLGLIIEALTHDKRRRSDPQAAYRAVRPEGDARFRPPRPCPTLGSRLRPSTRSETGRT